MQNYFYNDCIMIQCLIQGRVVGATQPVLGAEDALVDSARIV